MLRTALLAALLLAGPALAQPPAIAKPPGLRPDRLREDPRWLYDPLSKCSIYTTRTDPTLTARWYGPCVNEMAEGEGTIVYYRSNRYSAKYQGGVSQGARHGRGDYWTPAGDRFTVNWVWGVPEGQGDWRFADASTLSGVWRQGELRGPVDYVRADKVQYLGPLDGVGHAWFNGESPVAARLGYVAYQQPKILTGDGQVMPPWNGR